jgi:DNA-binding PadR family transcriptional regulator
VILKLCVAESTAHELINECRELGLLPPNPKHAPPGSESAMTVRYMTKVPEGFDLDRWLGIETKPGEHPGHGAVGDLPLAILRSISAASGETYRDIDGPELMLELQTRGFDPTEGTLTNVMFRLKDDDYIDGTRTGSGWGLIRLAGLGRQTVEGWPTAPRAISASDVEQLLSQVEERQLIRL